MVNPKIFKVCIHVMIFTKFIEQIIYKPDAKFAWMNI